MDQSLIVTGSFSHTPHPEGDRSKDKETKMEFHATFRRPDFVDPSGLIGDLRRGSSSAAAAALATGLDSSDLSFAAQDQGGGSVELMRAHKFVVSAGSEVIRDILKDHAKAAATIFLLGYGPKVVHLLLDFLYFGEVRVEEQDIGKFLNLAEELKVCGLSKYAIKSSADSQIQHPETQEKKDEEEIDQSKVVEPEVVVTEEIAKEVPKKKKKNGRRWYGRRRRTKRTREDASAANPRCANKRRRKDPGEDEGETTKGDVAAASQSLGPANDGRHELNVFVEANMDKTSVGEFVCLICGCIHKSKCNLVRHFSCKHFDGGPSYKCPSCQKIFKHKAAFAGHVYSKHKEWKGIKFEKYVMEK